MTLTNDALARRLRAHARALADRGDNLYRVRAFRQAAMAVLELREPAAEVLAREGTVPGIGESVARTLTAFVTTGAWDTAEAVRPATGKTTAGGPDRSEPPAGVTAV